MPTTDSLHESCPYCGPLRTTLEPEQHQQAMIVAVARVLNNWHEAGEELYDTAWMHLGWHLHRLDALRSARQEAVTA